jgi:Skp family chaperone for outer membrane proteins
MDPGRSHWGGRGLNLYQFNQNNPVAYTDPFGLCPQVPQLCVAAAVAIGKAGLAAARSPTGQRFIQNASDRAAAISTRVASQLGAMQTRLSNIMQELSTHDHLQAARLERTGKLATGQDHATELQSFANGLRTITVNLKNIMSNQQVSDELRQHATDMLKRVSPMLDEIKESLR